MKLLTIAIATYNMEAYLNRCLDSLIIKDQSLLDYVEVLIVNDGSKDNSLKIAQEYEARFPNVFRVIDKENGNYGSCINRAMDEAQGMYFKILDADDWYNTEEFSKFVKFISNNADKEIDVFFTEFCYHNFGSKTQKLYNFTGIDYEKSQLFYLFKIANTPNEFLIKMYSIAIKTVILRKLNLRLDEGISYTDNEYVLFPLPYVKNVVFLNYNVYQYFIGREGQTIGVEISDRMVSHLDIVANRIVDWYIESKGDKLKNIEVLVRNLVAVKTLAFIDRLLYLQKNDVRDKQLIDIYKKILQDNLLLKKMQKLSPFFYLWSKTGVYKSNKIIHLFYSCYRKLYPKH